MYRYKTIVVMLENLHYRRSQIWSGAQPFSGLASKICGIHFQLSWGCCSWVGTLSKQTAQLCDPTPTVASSNPQTPRSSIQEAADLTREGMSKFFNDKDAPRLCKGQDLVHEVHQHVDRKPFVSPSVLCGFLVVSSSHLCFVVSRLVMSPRPKCFRNSDSRPNRTS